MAESEQRTIARLLRDREPGMYPYDPVEAAGTNLSTRAVTLPWYPVSILAEALRGTGLMDERQESVIEGVPDSVSRPELYDIPGTQEWMQRQIGGDPTATENILADFATPDPFDVSKFAALVMGRTPLQGAKRLADSYFKKDELDKVRWVDKEGKERPRNHSKEVLIYMTPDEFLSMAKFLPEPDAGKAARVKDVAKSGERFNSLPFLYFDNLGDGMAQVSGHEGRHRAMYLRDQGVEVMPVVLKSREGGGAPAIRWSHFEDGWGDDWFERKDWPKILREEPTDAQLRLREHGLDIEGNEMTFPVGFEDNVSIEAAPHKPTTRIGKAMYRNQPGLNSLVRWITHLNDNKIKTMKVGKEGDNWVFYVEQTSEGSGKIMKYIRTPENPRKMLLRSEEDIPNIRSEMEKFDGEIIPIQGKFEA